MSGFQKVRDDCGKFSPTQSLFACYQFFPGSEWLVLLSCGKRLIKEIRFGSTVCDRFGGAAYF